MIKGFASHQRDADKITKLEVSSLISYNRFRYLSFPALTEVVLDAHYLPNYRPKVGTVRISSYLQPTLRKLHLRELFVLTIDAMDLICLRCPLLEDLELACQLAFNNPDEYLLHAPFSFPKLRRLVYKWDSIISPPLMQRLSEQLPLLEYLDIGHGDLDMWGGDSGPVFPELRTLILQLWPRPSVPDFEQNFKQTIASNHLSSLLRLAPKLEILRLSWSAPWHEPFQEEMNVNELRGLC